MQKLYPYILYLRKRHFFSFKITCHCVKTKQFDTAMKYSVDVTGRACAHTAVSEKGKNCLFLLRKRAHAKE